MTTAAHEHRADPIVIVGVDGSEQSDRAVDWAADFAKKSGRKLTLVAVWRFYDVAGAVMSDSGYTLEREADRILGVSRERAKAAGVDAHPVTAEGHTGKCLVKYAQPEDLLVVGSQGHNALTGALGSTSQYCLHHSPCTVVAVR